MEYKDKKAGLIVFGIFELLGGVGCVLLSLVTLIPLLMLPEDETQKQVAGGMLVYVFLAVWLIAVGIGTIRARRWVRVLSLAVNWLMLGCGVLAMIMLAFVLPDSFQAASLPEDMVKPVLVISYGVLAVFYLVLPGICILFYGGRNVRATIEHRDPGPSRLEQRPLPVLIFTLILLLAAGSLLMLGFMNFAMPFWGTIISGWVGAVVLLCCEAVCLALMVGAWELRPVAWWGTLTLLGLGLVSQLLTFNRIDVMDLYVAMGYSDQMLLQLSSMEWVNSTTFSWMAVYYVIPGIVFLLFLKRYFEAAKSKTMKEGERDV